MDFLFCKTQIKYSDKGFIYVVEVDGNYKIGRSITPKIRFGEYTRLYQEPKTICCEYVGNYVEMEKRLHNLFADKRIRGEWFKLDEKDILEIQKILKESVASIICETTEKKVFFKDKKIKLENGNYITITKSEKKLIELLKGSSSTYAAVNIMKHYLVSNYNVLIKDGRKYKATDLAEDMGITRQMATIHINKLKALNVLGMIETDKGKLYCLNPQYYFKGTEVPQSVLDIFDNTKKK